MTTTSDAERENKIRFLLDIFSIEGNNQVFIKHIPMAKDDEGDLDFSDYYKFIQLIGFFQSSDYDHMCGILKDILMYNKKFGVPLPAIKYYIDLCKG